MAADNSGDDELAEYRRDPPPPLANPKNREEIGRMNEELRRWTPRNRDYFRSPDFLKLHQLPSISPLWGYDESYYRETIARELMFITQAAGRRLTPDEVTVYLHHASRWTVAESYDRPAAIATTLFMANRGWNEFTFPFYQPSFQRFDPHVFPSTSLPLLRGRIAAASWQGGRCGLYSGLGILAYHLFAPTYRSLLNNNNLQVLEMEPRLKSLKRDTREAFDRLAREG
ncbi:hypothetical protein QBC46DRAFT_61064 [Diplogelasinospora grovesii]|uniref:Uncharacterized protein n=1 Tax=Diplogelasinospora grovesii TaxID=303347 RepID=A0AAN6S9A3_9PEZI|nr:hypothetical protein QBC46DRAFT_61064 [Diplogelasinospora grovesii]